MNDKIKLQLRTGEVVGLAKFLNKALTMIPKEDIVKDVADFLVLSALHELYTKVKPKAEEIRIFPTRRTDESYSVTITRTQALALCCVGIKEPENPSEIESYEGGFMKRLLGNIHHTFLV